MYVLEGTKRQNLPPHNVLMFFLHFDLLFRMGDGNMEREQNKKNLNSFTAARQQLGNLIRMFGK